MIERLEMQDDPVLPRRMDSLIDAVKPFFLRCLDFQIDVAGESPQRTIDRDGSFRFQGTA